MTSPDWTVGGRRDPVGPLSDIRARAIRGERLSGDEFGRLFAAGDEDLIYLNAKMRLPRPVEGAE